MEWSNKAKVWFGKGTWGHGTAHIQSVGVLQIHILKREWAMYEYSRGTASKEFVSAIPSLWMPGNTAQRGSCRTNNNWMGRGTPEFKPQCYNRNQHLSTAVVKQRSHPACKLTRDKPLLPCCRATCNTQGIMPEPSLQAWIHKSLSVLTSAVLWPYWQGLRKYLRSWKPEMFLSRPSLKALGLSGTRPQNLLPKSAQSAGLLTQFLCH